MNDLIQNILTLLKWNKKVKIHYDTHLSKNSVQINAVSQDGSIFFRKMHFCQNSSVYYISSRFKVMAVTPSVINIILQYYPLISQWPCEPNEVQQGKDKSAVLESGQVHIHVQSGRILSEQPCQDGLKCPGRLKT